MNNIVRKLEEFKDGKELLITFCDGAILCVRDCEGVDESIYNRCDLVVARFVSQVTGNKPPPKPGSAIQFSSDEVQAINGESVAHLR